MNAGLVFVIGSLIQLALIVLFDWLLPGPIAEYTNFVFDEGVLTIPVSSSTFSFQVDDEIDFFGEKRKITVVSGDTFVIASIS